METFRVDKILDAQGDFCPIPILKARKAMKGLQKGQVLEVLANDPGTVGDFRGWTRQTGHKLLGWTKEEGAFKVYVEKTT